MGFDDELCSERSSKRLARLSVDKKTDVILIAYEGKRKPMCEMCKNKVRFYTHFLLKTRHKHDMPKRIYKLCGSKECQSKALKSYMQTYVGSNTKGGKHGLESSVEKRGDVSEQ